MAEKRILLVEGNDDLNVLGHILFAHGIEVFTQRLSWIIEDASKKKGRIYIQDQEGVDKAKKRLNEKYFDNLLEDLSAELKGSEVMALGIIVDADLDIQTQWTSLANRLKNLKYENVPDLPLADGTILRENPDLPPVGIWLMPDNVSNGMLEDFLKPLIPEEKKNIWQKAVDAVSAIPQDERLFVTKENDTIKSDKTAKAQIHTYLAWQERPGVPYGVAIREKFLKADSPHASGLMTWIKNLYSL